MSRNKKIRRNIAGLEKSVREHEEKIEIERSMPAPNLERIAYWESEVESFKKAMDRLLRRLRREW